MITFAVVSELFYVILMFIIPKDIMQHEMAHQLVDQMAGILPKIRHLQDHVRRSGISPVLPFYYSVVCLWCFSVGTLVAIIFRKYRSKDAPERLENKKQLYQHLGWGVIVFFVLFIYAFVYGPPGSYRLFSYSEFFFGYRITAALLGGIYVTILYMASMHFILNLRNYFLLICSYRMENYE